MKKTIMLIAGIVVLLLFSSAFRGGIAPLAGSIAPSVVVKNQDSEFMLDKLRGKYVMLSFWSSSDAGSRLRCNELNSFVKSFNESNSKEEQICFMSVNFDRSERLFNEIMRRDNLDAYSQFYVSGHNASKIKRDYGLEKGFKTFLVDPSGVIVAVNPKIEDLTKILSLNN